VTVCAEAVKVDDGERGPPTSATDPHDLLLLSLAKIREGFLGADQVALDVLREIFDVGRIAQARPGAQRDPHDHGHQQNQNALGTCSACRHVFPLSGAVRHAIRGRVSGKATLWVSRPAGNAGGTAGGIR
jgi:hypothetical protein